jgi:lysophospholipid acyltransferase
MLFHNLVFATFFDSGMDHNPLFLQDLFKSVGDGLGLNNSFAAFLMLQIATVLMGFVLRRVSNAFLRKGLSLGTGLLWCHILYGPKNVLLLTCISALFYILPVYDFLSARSVMILGVSVLSLFHIYRMWESYMSWALDVTGPLMLLTAKFTSFAYDIEDGRHYIKGTPLSPTEHVAEARKRTCISIPPSVFEYYVFVFDFLGILAGPIFHLREYLDFMYLRNDFSDLSHVSFFATIVERFTYTVVIGVCFTLAGMFPQLSFAYIETEEFIASSLITRIVMVNIITAANRLRYYFAWYMADVACLVSGIGYHPSHREKYSRGQNAIISMVDFANCQSEALSHWNISISKWLRENVYLRALEAPVPAMCRSVLGHRQYATILTRFVSAFWHGFYPGYYLCFISTVLQSEADTIARKFIKPIFTRDNATKPHWVYTLGGKMHTGICLNYYGSAFLVLSTSSALHIWKSLFFSVHLLNIATIVLVPVVCKTFGRKKSDSQEKKEL